MNPFVFIVGNPRSGTTLLRHVVDSHPQIAILKETAWLMNWYEKGLGLSAEGTLTSAFITPFLSKHRLFRDVDLGLNAQELDSWIQPSPPLAWAKFISMLCDRYGQARQKPLVGNKTPSFVRRILVMHALWPQAKFIHIIRDGRDVCLSARVKWNDKPNFRNFSTWSQDMVTTAALWWEWNVRLGREAGLSLPPDVYFEVRYERLVEDPETECRRLCDFLRVGFDSAMLRHQEAFETKYHRDGRVINARVALPITPGLRSWRVEMDPDEVVRFEASAGSLLNELGYPLSGLPLPTQSREHASQVRGLFEGRPLPQRWDGSHPAVQS